MLLSYKNYYHSTSSTGINKKESNKQSSGWLFIQWMAVTNLWTTWTRSWACLIHLTITMSPLKWHCNAFKRWIVYLFCVCLLLFFLPTDNETSLKTFWGIWHQKGQRLPSVWCFVSVMLIVLKRSLPSLVFPNFYQ